MYNEEIWSPRVLIPTWIIQILLQFFTILSLAALMALETGILKTVPSSDVVFMIFLILTLMANPTEMLLKSLSALEPSLYLSAQVFKMLFAIAFAANEMYRYFNLKNRDLFPLSQAAGFVWMLIVNAGLGILGTLGSRFVHHFGMV